MPELLVFAWDHSTQTKPTPSKEQLAALPKLYDVIAWRPDGWAWGAEELNNPLFRIIKVPTARTSDLDALVTRLEPTLDKDMKPITLAQYRASYFDFSNPIVPAAVKSWFADEKRDEGTKQVAIGVDDVVAVKTARAEVPVDQKQ